MQPVNICQPNEPKASCWVRLAVVGLLGAVGLLSVVLSFAVEFMAAGPDLHRRAHVLLDATQVSAAVEVYAGTAQPSRPAH